MRLSKEMAMESPSDRTDIADSPSGRGSARVRQPKTAHRPPPHAARQKGGQQTGKQGRQADGSKHSDKSR